MSSAKRNRLGSADRGTVKEIGTDAGPFPRVGFVSTYPPTVCGLASFTASLRNAMARQRGTGEGLSVVRVLDGIDAGTAIGTELIADLNPADDRSVRAAAKRLASFDAVILQHEYGIWGPGLGKAVLDLADQIEAPLITTLHTVLADPNEMQRWVLERLVAHSTLAVVPTLSAHRLLIGRYRIDPRSTTVIPHGTDVLSRDIPPEGGDNAGPSDPAPTLLTWGLMGPSKGLEWALRAVWLLRDRFPGLRYVIAGRTHPKVVDVQGEAYRIALENMVAVLDLGRTVEFIDDYLPREVLHELLQAAAVVVLPYDSTEQVVSGVLVEAVAAAVPVVATAFPHAVELAEEGAVVTVPHRSPQTLADAIAGLLESPLTRCQTVETQRRLAPSLEWSNVAGQYERVVREVARLPAALDA